VTYYIVSDVTKFLTSPSQTSECYSVCLHHFKFVMVTRHHVFEAKKSMPFKTFHNCTELKKAKNHYTEWVIIHSFFTYAWR